MLNTSSGLACMQSKAQPNSAAAAQASAAHQDPLANGHSSADAVNAQLATAAPLTSFNPAEVTAAAEAEDGAGGEAATATAVSAALAVSDDPPSKKVSCIPSWMQCKSALCMHPCPGLSWL